MGYDRAVVADGGLPLAEVDMKLKKYKEAKEVLQKAHTKEPKESIIAEHLADVLVKLGEFDEAKRLYELSIKLGPDNTEVREHLEQKVAALKRGKPLDPCEPWGANPVALSRHSECNTARVQQPATRTPSASSKN